MCSGNRSLSQLGVPRLSNYSTLAEPRMHRKHLTSAIKIFFVCCACFCRTAGAAVVAVLCRGMPLFCEKRKEINCTALECWSTLSCAHCRPPLVRRTRAGGQQAEEAEDSTKEIQPVAALCRCATSLCNSQFLQRKRQTS